MAGHSSRIRYSTVYDDQPENQEASVGSSFAELLYGHMGGRLVPVLEYNVYISGAIIHEPPSE